MFGVTVITDLFGINCSETLTTRLTELYCQYIHGIPNNVGVDIISEIYNGFNAEHSSNADVYMLSKLCEQISFMTTLTTTVSCKN